MSSGGVAGCVDAGYVGYGGVVWGGGGAGDVDD